MTQAVLQVLLCSLISSLYLYSYHKFTPRLSLRRKTNLLLILKICYFALIGLCAFIVNGYILAVFLSIVHFFHFKNSERRSYAAEKNLSAKETLIKRCFTKFMKIKELCKKSTYKTFSILKCFLIHASVFSISRSINLFIFSVIHNDSNLWTPEFLTSLALAVYFTSLILTIDLHAQSKRSYKFIGPLQKIETKIAILSGKIQVSTGILIFAITPPSILNMVLTEPFPHIHTGLWIVILLLAYPSVQFILNLASITQRKQLKRKYPHAHPIAIEAQARKACLYTQKSYHLLLIAIAVLLIFHHNKFLLNCFTNLLSDPSSLKTLLFTTVPLLVPVMIIKSLRFGQPGDLFYFPAQDQYYILKQNKFLIFAVLVGENNHKSIKFYGTLLKNAELCSKREDLKLHFKFFVGDKDLSTELKNKILSFIRGSKEISLAPAHEHSISIQKIHDYLHVSFTIAPPIWKVISIKTMLHNYIINVFDDYPATIPPSEKIKAGRVIQS